MELCHCALYCIVTLPNNQRAIVSLVAAWPCLFCNSASSWHVLTITLLACNSLVSIAAPSAVCESPVWPFPVVARRSLKKDLFILGSHPSPLIVLLCLFARTFEILRHGSVSSFSLSPSVCVCSASTTLLSTLPAETTAKDPHREVCFGSCFLVVPSQTWSFSRALFLLLLVRHCGAAFRILLASRRLSSTTASASPFSHSAKPKPFPPAQHSPPHSTQGQLRDLRLTPSGLTRSVLVDPSSLFPHLHLLLPLQRTAAPISLCHQLGRSTAASWQSTLALVRAQPFRTQHRCFGLPPSSPLPPR